MRKIMIFIICTAFLTGCTSTGRVHDKAYIRAVGIDGDTLTLAFFSDERIITGSGDDITSALRAAEIKSGSPIVTGYTELIVLGRCSKRDVLQTLLTDWKVSPECLAVTSRSIPDTLRKGNPRQLEGSVKEAVKQGKVPECGIVDVLSLLLNGKTVTLPEVSADGYTDNYSLITASFISRT